MKFSSCQKVDVFIHVDVYEQHKMCVRTGVKQVLTLYGK